MVRAWYMDENTWDDQRLEHHQDPPRYIEIAELCSKTGVECFKLNVDTYLTDGVLDEIRQKRNYSYEDEITCSEDRLPDYKNALKKFYMEHLHTDEEIRFVLNGSGYFDVRDVDDQWIRIEVTPGDMVVLPSGIYHRFTLDTKNYINVKRYFIGNPIWEAFNRPSDEMEVRLNYTQRMANGFQL